MDFVGGIIGAAIAVHASFALLFLIVRIRRPGDEEYGTLSALCAALAFLSAARVVEGRATSPADLLSASRYASVALIGALVLLFHFALDYARPSARRPWMVFAYGLATAYALLNARGLLNDVPALAQATTTERLAPLSALGVSMYGAGIASAGGALLLFGGQYLRGRKEALALVAGVTIVVAALLNDAGYHAGLFTSTHLSTLGFLGIVAGGASTLVSRYVAAAGEAIRRGAEARARTRELRRALADLGAAEEELGRKEQLAVVGELAAVIAHEVRNPLAIIANAVAGLRKPTLGKDDQATLLSILDDETTRLNRLVSDLLRYARPVNVQRQSLSLRELVERGLQLAKNHPAMQTHLKVEAADAQIWGDGNLLRQAFENLIDNAMQAMNFSGVLTVRVREMNHDGKDGLAVDIIDTGEGMDTIVRSRARDPFFTTRPSGTGLGLAIVDRIVEAHGGGLLIESRTGEGTTATVFVPSGSPSEPSPPRSYNPAGQRRGSSPAMKEKTEPGE